RGVSTVLSDNQELLEVTELVINGPRQECSSACWNGIILQATSKVFVFSGLRAARLGLGGVCVLEVSQLRVGHRERRGGRKTDHGGKFTLKPEGANRRRIKVAAAMS